MKRINDVFHPKKITFKGKAKIVDTSSGQYVIKTKQKDIPSLYEYLNVRNFNNYPRIIDEYDNNYVYEYVEEKKLPINQKASDMASVLSSLHNKTAHFKPIVKDHIKEIYENILGNITYSETYYENLFKAIEIEEFMRPSHYLLIRNRSRFIGLYKYLKTELENWYKMTDEQTKERVVSCHNNLSIDHYIKGESEYFISWDNYTIDSPVLDLLNLYKNDHLKYDFSNFLEEYIKKFPLLEEEKKLLFIVLSLPNEVIFIDNELENTVNVGKLMEYITSTEILIRPYYTKKHVEQ